MPRRLLHIPRFALRVLLFGLLAGVLLYFGLTRTQVGRDGLRDQIERAFADAFEGQISVGRLTGNLVNDLYASDVRVLDGQGRVVLRVDSVVAAPSWRSLFRRRVSLGSLTLIRPHLMLHYQADGTWNAASALRRRMPSATAAEVPWTLDAAEVRILEGRVTTTREGAPPPLVETGWLFDYTQAEVRALEGRATIEWSRAVRLIDLLDLSAVLVSPAMPLHTASGQFVFDDGGLALSQFTLRLGDTDLALDGTYRPGLDAATVALDLQESRVDLGGLRPLVPRLPLDDALTLSGRLQGPLDDLTAEDLVLQRGRSAVRADGRLRLGPDSLAFAAALERSTLYDADVRAVWPGAPLPAAPLGPLTLALDAEGTAGGGRLRAVGDLDVRGRAGRLRGPVSVRHQPGRALAYAFTLDADSLDLGRLLHRPALASRLRGRLQMQGRGLSLDSLDAHVVAGLRDAVLAGRHADSLYVDATIVRRQVSAAAFAREQGGSISLTTQIDLRGRPRYEAGIFTRRLDLGPWLGLDALSTTLDSRWTLDGSGATVETLQGALTLHADSSVVRWHGDPRLLAPHTTTLAVRAPGTDGPRLALSGDVAHLTVDGMPSTRPLAPLARLWGEALAEIVRTALPPASSTDEANVEDADASPPPDPSAADREAARAALAAAGLDALAFDASFRLERPDLLMALLPFLPPLQARVRADVQVRADADSLRLIATAHDDVLRVPGLRADSLRARLYAMAALDRTPTHRLQADATLDAGRLVVAGDTLRAPSATLSLDESRGRLTVAAAGTPERGPVRLEADLGLLPGRTRLTLRDMRVPVGPYEWIHPAAEPVALYADAVVIPGLVFESRAAGEAPQRLRLRGTLSNASQDTLFIAADALSLDRLSETLGLRRALGGRLHAEAAFTRTDHPELTGTLTIDDLAFGDRLLGQLAVTSTYVPGSSDVALDATLRPAAVAPGGLRPTENHLHLTGTFRFPTRDDPGALDLALTAGRADAFFFEYLFRDLVADVRGGITGEGTISGSFRKPLFEAAVRVEDGAFAVPDFNLRYAIDGPVTVDGGGIRLRGVQLADPTGGTARVDGAILFNDYRFFSFDLAASLDELQIIDVAQSPDLPFYGHIWASGGATLTGPLSSAFLRAENMTTAPRSEVFIPIAEAETVSDPGFIVFADSAGRVAPPVARQRTSILGQRAAGERTFLDGLAMDLNLFAPLGSTVHLVIDPLLGDVINAVGSGRIQIQRREGDFAMYGTLDVEAGDYLFTAGEVFVRRFLIDDGSITWDGDPLDARLAIDGAYRTRAATTGLPPEIAGRLQGLVPVVVDLRINGRVSSPLVDLRLAIDRSRQDAISDTDFVEGYLNQPDRAAQLATSVLLTNSFLLAAEAGQSGVVAGSAFTSVSQLVSSQLNRYLSQVLPNADFRFGLQRDAEAQDLDVTAGLALRLLNERLVIRGQGVYRGLGDEPSTTAQPGLEGEFVVEVRLNPSVSVEVFYRREGDVLSETLLTSSTGAGLSYQTQFPTWRRLLQRLVGPEPDSTAAPTAGASSE